MTTLSFKLRTALAASALALASLASAPRAQAQRPLVQANVPFDFEYGNAHMKAGKYRVNLTTTNILELQGRPSSAFGMVQWNGGIHPTETGKLVFHKYGDVYLLREIWIPGQTEHASLPKSKSERVLQELSQNKTSAPTDVEVALVDTPR